MNSAHDRWWFSSRFAPTRRRPALRWSMAVAVLGGCGALLACAEPADPRDLDAILEDGALTVLSGGAPPALSSDAGPAGGDGFPRQAQGLWLFDDCNPERSDLVDAAVDAHTAYRAVSVACAPGIAGLGIAIAGAEDLVYVPDQPSFNFQDGITAAAWVKPHHLGGVRTILRKRQGGTSTFVLLSNGRDYQFVIRLDSGRAAAVSARATLDQFTHVAGTYDGQELRLYLNGALAASTRVAGRLAAGAGPLLMGNDVWGRRIDGTLDSVFFDVHPATPDQVTRLNCLAGPSMLAGVPPASPPVVPGTAVTFDVELTNHACDPQLFRFQAASSSSDLAVSPALDVQTVAPGASAHLSLVASSSAQLEPDDYPIALVAISDGAAGAVPERLTTSVTYSMVTSPCSIRTRKELEIRDLSVVEDPVRTGPGGAWTFGRLMQDLAPTPDAAPAMVEALLGSWLTEQTVNGSTIPARPLMQELIVTPFPRTPAGQLDLARAPFRLLAIVNRIDLQDLASGSAGEGRFVFGLLDPQGAPLSLTMIVEYNIPAASAQDVRDLANAWHGLATLPLPSPAYNTALQAVTDRFTTRNAAPGRVNGSALGQLRSNDFFTLGEWELREFHLSPATGQLQPATVALTPDRRFNNTPALASYINANQAAILLEKHTVPETFDGQPFRGASMISNFFVWNAPGVNPEARAKFALNTCNGCHNAPLETNTVVFQIAPRERGQESSLSPFLLGTQLFDPLAGVTRTFNELGRRRQLLSALICPTDPPPSP